MLENVIKKMFRNEKNNFCYGRDIHEIFYYNKHPFFSQICLDIIDPTPIRNGVLNYGIEFLFITSGFSVDYLITLAKARSLENQIITIIANRCGEDLDGVRYLGRSCICFPDGRIFEAGNKEEMKIMELKESDLIMHATKRIELNIFDQII